MTEHIHDTNINTTDQDKKLVGVYRHGTNPFGHLNTVAKYQNDASFPIGIPWTITIKEDGTQVWTLWELVNDNLRLVFIRSHGGGIVYDHTKYPNGFDSPKEFYDAKIEFQRASLWKTLGTEKIWVSIKEMMHNLKTDRLHLYLEHILPGKSPCRLPYKEDQLDKGHFFEAVWFLPAEASEEATKLVRHSLHHTRQSDIDHLWGDLPTITIVDSGDSFSTDDFKKIVAWVENNPQYEGAMLDFGGIICKIKVPHASSIRPDNYERLEFSPFHQAILKIYDEAIARSKTANVKSESDIMRKKKPEVPKSIILEEISKAWSKMLPNDIQSLLSQIMKEKCIGTSKKQLIAFSQIVGQSSVKETVFKSIEEEMTSSLSEQGSSADASPLSIRVNDLIKGSKKEILYQLKNFIRKMIVEEQSGDASGEAK